MGQATAGQQHYARERSMPALQSDRCRQREPFMGGAWDDSMDTLLYHNLVEMIPLVPLVDSLAQDQQPSKSFPRHASLVYTPTPLREAWPFKKAVDHSANGKQARGRLLSSKKSDLKDSPLWDNAENMRHQDQNLYSEDIPMLPYPSNHRANRSVASSVETIQLRIKVQQLEQKLSEKECQLQVAETNTQQVHLQLNAKVERLQSQIQQKDQAIQNVQNQLFERQLEVVSLQSLVKKSEVNMQASSMKAAGLEEELDMLKSQVGALLYLVQSQMSSLQEEQAISTPPLPEEEQEEEPSSALDEALTFEEHAIAEEPVSSASCDIPSSGGMKASLPQYSGEEEERIEETRRKYLAALDVARENPTDEVLSLVAELREELHALVVTCLPAPAAAGIDTTTDGGGQCWQPLGLSVCQQANFVHVL